MRAGVIVGCGWGWWVGGWDGGFIYPLAHVCVSPPPQYTRLLYLPTQTAGVATWEGVVEAMEQARHPLEYAWGVVNHLLGVQNSDALREAHQAVQPEVVDLFTRVRHATCTRWGVRVLVVGAWMRL